MKLILKGGMRCRVAIDQAQQEADQEKAVVEREDAEVLAPAHRDVASARNVDIKASINVECLVINKRVQNAAQK